MSTSENVWPILRSYEGDQLDRIAMPIGGIGTGSISLGGRGNLQDWEMVNRPAKGFRPNNAFFALWCKPAGGQAVTRVLEGPIPDHQFEGHSGSAASAHNLPRFRHCTFGASYPLAQVSLRDPEVPLQVRIEAFNPLIPADDEASGLPVVVMRFVLINRSSKAVQASVCGSMQNIIGADGSGGGYDWKGDHDAVAKLVGNRNEYRSGRDVRGVIFTAPKLDPAAEQWGTMAIATTGASNVSHRTAWAELSWGGWLLDFWDDFSVDGKLEPREVRDNNTPVGSIAAGVRVPPKSQRTLTFLITWHFPNRMTWTPKAPNPDAQAQSGASESAASGPNPNRIGNYYTTLYRDAWDAAEKIAPKLPELEERTVEFVRAVVESDMPDVVKEAALFNLSTLKTQTVFRTEDGRFFAWEGCGDSVGFCHGTCTHVWNYEYATGFLFGKLARMMREVEFGHATDEKGHMCFRVDLPLDRAQGSKLAAADGQMGTILRFYRDWKFSGDEDFIQSLYPHVKRAMEFCWIEGGWDADQDGVMEGCQHNTMDVEYFGPNPEISSWYLAALRACEEMGRHMGDTQFADKCRSLHDRGRAWVDQHLFNGEWYEQKIIPITDPNKIAPGIRGGMGSRGLEKPELQVGPGCLIDQLVGQVAAHVCDLGHILDPSHVKTTLRSIRKYNFRTNFWGHFNFLRTYALQDEAGTLMCTYPRGGRPEQPFPYAAEVWTGLEYTAAVGMIQEGLVEDGLKLIEAARSRFDGRRRSPFDEAECGHHYARAMASWAAIPAMSGFGFDAVKQEIRFARAQKPVKWFFSTGDAWGTVRLKPSKSSIKAEITLLGGQLTLRRLVLRHYGACDLVAPAKLTAGKTVACAVEKGTL